MRVAEPENIVLKDVSVFGDNTDGELSVRLEDINLVMAPGEWLSVVGVNGSGKSTLARLLAGLQADHVTGEIIRGFAGQSCPIVLQQPKSQLFGETPREEVVFALQWRGIALENINALVERALNRTGLTAVADSTWDRLSGGQQQLAAIAAATAGETKLLVLDEATSMLDDSNRDAVMRIARDLNRNGTAVVWVTQRLDELEPDSRVVAIGGGSVIFDGESREFLYGISEELVEAKEARGRRSVSPCLRAGLRLPYLAAMAMELRDIGKLNDPLPMTALEWGKVLENVGDEGK
ncbi:energy-coupling factor ABC transporter ATP-binding protein [Cohnella lupini]|uniref:Energy-coupling factor transport system ATP-binding protein n=1 Tax=Cohnella lupini TaxID=1294267 RepID=A0A3D9IWN5_9BACL|nr:ABC transporter ATP-binding protein [Cohnella lupini]RED66115.1 energy-coupling factor transport system ATP-binding protein [Cohnella lupini]